MTSAQLRAARGLLNWTVRDLSERSGVHRNTITNMETGKATQSPTITAVKLALEQAGVIFIDQNGEGPGVRLRMDR